MTTSGDVRELDASETHLAFPAMVELRPHLETVERFVEQVNGTQRAAGYRLGASFDGDDVAAVAGFREGHSLAWGHHLYVDDLVTLPSTRDAATRVSSSSGSVPKRAGSAASRSISTPGRTVMTHIACT